MVMTGPQTMMCSLDGCKCIRPCCYKHVRIKRNDGKRMQEGLQEGSPALAEGIQEDPPGV